MTFAERNKGCWRGYHEVGNAAQVEQCLWRLAPCRACWQRMDKGWAPANVFAPKQIRPVKDDEEYVIRCCSDEGDHEETFFHAEPLLNTDYDILVVRRVEWVPLEPLKEIFPEIRKKANIVYVVHERKPPSNPLFYSFHWDAIVCFDERYSKQWLTRFSDDMVRIIPYRAGPLRRGDRREARKELDLPLGGKIVFSYGWAPELHVFPILSSLQELSRRFPFTYLVLADPEYIAADIERLKSYDFIELRQELAPMDGIFAYLHASDVYLMHKQKEETRPGEAVVPSAILMCLGALTPTMTSNTEFVWFLDREVMKYSSSDELKELLVKAFKGDRIFKKTVKAGEEYALHHSPEKIAKEFITLFERLAG